MSKELKIVNIILLVLEAGGAICGLVPYSPWWLSVTVFVFFGVSTLTLTILAILYGKGIIK